MRPRLDRTAVAIFGTFRERPRLPQAEIEKFWDTMDPVFKKMWLEAAEHALKASAGPA